MYCRLQGARWWAKFCKRILRGSGPCEQFCQTFWKLFFFKLLYCNVALVWVSVVNTGLPVLWAGHSSGSLERWRVLNVFFSCFQPGSQQVFTQKKSTICYWRRCLWIMIQKVFTNQGIAWIFVRTWLSLLSVSQRDPNNTRQGLVGYPGSKWHSQHHVVI